MGIWWNFTTFRVLRFLKRELMLYRSPIASYYISGAFFQNVRVCLYGNETSLYFQNEEIIDIRMDINDYLNLIDKE